MGWVHCPRRKLRFQQFNIKIYPPLTRGETGGFFVAKPPTHPVTNLAAWFTVVASNRVKDGYRSEAARQRAVAKLGMPVEETTDAIELLDVDVAEAL